MNIIRHIRNIFKKYVIKINEQAILNWKNWLDKAYPTGPWVPIDGFYTMTSLSFDANSNPVFNGNAGYPLKGFLSSSTGEVKIFDARKFYA